MPSKISRAAAAMLIIAAAKVASGQTLFSENFNDGLAGSRWGTVSGSDSGTNDILVNLAFDYSALGIPAAPGGGGTTGAQLDANRTAEGALEAEGLSIYPNSQSFSGDFVFRVDLWARVSGAAGTTEDSIYGVNATGSRANWYSFAGPGTDGLFYSVTGDGGTGADNDYISYTGNPGGDPVAIALYDHLDPLPQSVFKPDPIDPFDEGGAPTNRWTTVEVASINGRLMFRMNGEVFDIFDNSVFSSGNVFLGHQDLFNSINTDTFSIYDNARVVRAHGWAVDADGGWDTAANWASGSVPSGADAIAFFGNNVSGPRTIAFGLAKTAGDVVFDSAQPYAIVGTSVFTLNGTQQDSSIAVIRGEHKLDVPVTAARNTLISLRDGAAVGPSLTLGGDFNFAGVKVRKSGDGRLAVKNLRGGDFEFAGGSVTIMPSGTAAGASKVSSLTIAGDATPTAALDITNNLLVVDYSGPSPYATIKAQVISGRASGAYNGNGINSSAAAVTTNREIGYAEAAALGGGGTLLGQSYDSSAVLVRYTLPGDSNLNGTVEIGDFAILAANFNTSGDWQTGDSNYDGLTNINDFALLAGNFNQTVSADLPRGSLLGGDFALLAANFNQSSGELPRGAIPEPGSAAMLAILVPFACRRARAQRS